MAAQSSNVLNMLQGLASKEVDEAAEALAKAMKVATEAQAKQDMLNEYRLDYVRNLNKILEAGMGAEAYQNFQNFFGKLDQAIAGQQEVVELANQQVKIQKQLWQESQRKKLSYEVLSDRSDKRVLKVEQKKDQKMMDEFAMRITRTRHS
ncbi:MAG: flagellar export protein FliJ [Methylotenera sp.]|uniref:flagellar export protein FliJ n=1 Tax=Methylotenera sp. TaxID=2051956 RepID=UPI002725B70E|nr:flagellar export protein FliJ [Methylotenera sp.]MDO9204343.1 flagellar export protein FliJ [Methylotenera sp.]MDO9392352.1 flagellar export protein FliJ [Methylotenera sp.]MDP1522536.1 flagellar export protein FliJ [Methylotenera sp.]MDP3308124.1 flagellar export protein FliJ [Methylotenera sp.]MDP3818950.1 flagellar export protein FliJ [Methylotenera sp.]